MLSIFKVSGPATKGIRCCIALVALLGISNTSSAEESLLWKTINPASAVVVPTYAGQGSPFPVTVAPVEETSATDVLDEQARLKEEAYNNAQNILKSGNALVPDLRAVVVGGMVEGNLGPRVLINNQWLGVGDKLTVRQYKTSSAIEALKVLAELDATAGEEIKQALDTKLSQNPTVALSLRRITSSSIVLHGPQGEQVVKMNMNSN